MFKLEKPPKRSGLENKFLCSMIWIATGLISSSVNWAFTCYRRNQREIIRHLKMFLFHPFLNIWYFLSDILSDTLSDSCSAASKTNRLFAANFTSLLLWIHKKIFQMFGKYNWSFEDTFLSNTWILVQSDKNHYTSLVVRQYRCSENSNSAASK